MSHDTCSGGSMRPRLTPRTFEVLSFCCCAFVVVVGERVYCCVSDGAQIVAQILAHTPAWRADRCGARAASARAGADQAQLAVPRGAQDRAGPNFTGLATLGLQIGVFCGLLDRALILSAGLGLGFSSGRAPLPAAGTAPSASRRWRRCCRRRRREL